MKEILAGICLIAGSLFCFLAAVGLMRLPDLYSRMQATTKGITLGLLLCVLGAAIYFATPATWTRGVMVVAFVFITSPIAAHLIARSSHRVGIRQPEGAICDDLEDQPSGTRR